MNMPEPPTEDLSVALGISPDRMAALSGLIFNAYVEGIERNARYCEIFQELAEKIASPLELIFTGYVMKTNEDLIFREAGFAVYQKRLGLVGYG